MVSGDNHVSTYDESSDMKTALISQGIPSSVIYCDYAGFRTLDSIVRAKQVFGATNITVISQQFHNERAIFIAKQNKINAIGFNAREVGRFNSFSPSGRDRREGVYKDIKGFCKSATIKDIRKHAHVLTPGRYVGIPDEEDDLIPFDEKMADLTSTLKQQMDKEVELNNEIEKQLSKIGFTL